MKDSTKIRLHLSKALVESLTKQVIREGKSNMGGGAYTEAVKVPKAAKKASTMDEMSSKKKMEKASTMDEMSSKQKMKLGLYKENEGLNEDANEMWMNFVNAVTDPEIINIIGRKLEMNKDQLMNFFASGGTLGTLGALLARAAKKDKERANQGNQPK